MTEYEAVHRKAFSMLMTEFLYAVVETVISPYHFFKAQVNFEMTKSLTYFVKVAISEDGKIIQSMCECNAGAVPQAVCKHVGVLCYAVLKFTDSGVWHLRKTCTQKKQLWHAPKKTRVNISPKKAEHLNLIVNEFNKNKRHKGKLLYNPRPDDAVTKEEFTRHVHMSTINFCHENSKHLGGILPTVSSAAVNHDHDYFEVPLAHLQVLNMIKVSAEQARAIEAKTRKQARCKLWHTERSLRVTASNVAEICKFTQRRNKEQFAERLVSPSPLYVEPVL